MSLYAFIVLEGKLYLIREDQDLLQKATKRISQPQFFGSIVGSFFESQCKDGF